MKKYTKEQQRLIIIARMTERSLEQSIELLELSRKAGMNESVSASLETLHRETEQSLQKDKDNLWKKYRINYDKLNKEEIDELIEKYVDS